MSVGGAYRLGVVIVAAGSGERFGKRDKVLADLAGKPMLTHSLAIFASLPDVHEVVVVAGAHTREVISRILTTRSQVRMSMCAGGSTRRESVLAGLDALPAGIDLVVVHDAARPLVTPEVVERVVEAAALHGAAVPVLPVSDTLYQTDANGSIVAVADRSLFRSAQTPQAARRDWLESALRVEPAATDEGSALLAQGFSVYAVAGCSENIKITWPGDLQIAEAILSRRQS